MKQGLKKAMGALAIGGALVSAAATPAAARPWGYGGGYHYYHGGGHAGAIIGAGALGLAVGAALAPHYGYGYRGYYAPPPPPPPAYYGYYGRPAYYGGYYGCRHVTRWDPYVGGWVRVPAC